MLNEGNGVRIRHPVLTALVAVVLCWMGLQVWVGSGREVPASPWLATALLLLMAACVVAAGLDIRRYQRGTAREMPTPERARATLVAGQSSALGGAVIVGWYAAQALTHLPNADVPSVRGEMIRALVLAACAGLLVAAGLATQAMCRIPPEDDDEDDDDGAQEIW